MKKTFNQELFSTSLVILACLFLFSIFPTKNIFQEIISSLTFFFVVPILYVKIILKKDLKEFGIQLGDRRKGIIFSSLALIMSLLIAYVFFQYSSFSKNYTLPEIIKNNFIFFIIYELFIVGFFTALYEFFFRGFIQFSFLKKVGFWSIILQTVLFVLMFLVTGSFGWSIVPFVVIAPFSGFVAWKSNSIVYSFFSTLIFIMLIDAFVIKFVK